MIYLLNIKYNPIILIAQCSTLLIIMILDSVLLINTLFFQILKFEYELSTFNDQSIFTQNSDYKFLIDL